MPISHPPTTQAPPAKSLSRPARAPSGPAPRAPSPALRAPRFWLREPFNGLSHLAGALLAVAALAALLIATRGRPRAQLGCALYGVGLIAVYAASTFYHGLRVGRRAHDWLGRLDYIAIFLLIAGTFAPLCLVTLRGPVGAAFLAAEYGLALLGILGVLLWGRMPDAVRVGLCLAMGWLAVPLLPHLRAALPPGAVAWLVAGGAAYTAGVPVLALDRPGLWPGRNCAHGVWHLFVLAGSACHFVLIWHFVARAA